MLTRCCRPGASVPSPRHWQPQIIAHMHLLIPFAATMSAPGRSAAASLVLPHLRRLLGRLNQAQWDRGEELSLSTPHERALATALGLQGPSGLLPWGAHLAKADGVEVGTAPWGLVTPGHWHVGTDQVSLMNPADLGLDDTTSRRLFAAVRGLFTSEGFLLRYGAALRWYASHDSLASLPTASLDRVIGRNVDRWLGHDAAADRMRRLQSEVQMLLYTHPLNDERQARGLLPVNSFWLSGCGPLQAAWGSAPTVDERLRAPALNEDWAAWVKAWHTLDEGPLAQAVQASQRGESVVLTLCGERSAVTMQRGPRAAWSILTSMFGGTAVLPLLNSL
jgi:hypothetical protein